ncbi:Protein GlcG [Seminavis robusta]|uniref:Protein GlcG n=1 Tax=Seminavis robusta TaxID=568900 RepID=A0A9N8F0D3_9STRA|nr:Protein GlcG [Seminavis robusta]|eukprot:Sro2348_g324340.1 Protein GlcG (157) ;mRNA; f:14731-15201
MSATDNLPVSYIEPSGVLTPAAAMIGMTAALKTAAQAKWEVTVCICDAGGVPIHVQRTANAFPASYDIACGKAKSAALFRKETGLLEDSVNGGRSALLSSPFVLMRGGIPVLWNNGTQACGAVGVSGVQADQDETVARAAVDAMTAAFSMSSRSKL